MQVDCVLLLVPCGHCVCVLIVMCARGRSRLSPVYEGPPFASCVRGPSVCLLCTRAPPFVSCVPLGKVLRRCFEDICKLLVANESRLNDLDKASGDGDTGTTLRNGATGEHHR